MRSRARGVSAVGALLAVAVLTLTACGESASRGSNSCTVVSESGTVAVTFHEQNAGRRCQEFLARFGSEGWSSLEAGEPLAAFHDVCGARAEDVVLWVKASSTASSAEAQAVANEVCEPLIAGGYERIGDS
jgi:hypothetical protein